MFLNLDIIEIEHILFSFTFKRKKHAKDLEKSVDSDPLLATVMVNVAMMNKICIVWKVLVQRPELRSRADVRSDFFVF